jgi:excisionase family DNA binding protein
MSPAHTAPAKPPAAPVSQPPLPTLDLAAAAQYCHLSVRFLRTLVAERRVTFFKVGKFVRFRQSDLDQFMLAGRVDPWQG